MPVNVLSRHEIFRCILQEQILQELKSDPVRFLVRSIQVIRPITDKLGKHFELLGFLVLETAFSSHHSVENCLYIFNLLRLLVEFC